MNSAEITAFLAERGLAYIKGAPPKEEDCVLLVWLGGCNAVAACWMGEHLVVCSGAPNGQRIRLNEVECWMRMPHPSFWPMADMPESMIPDRELYEPAKDIFEAAESERTLARPVQLNEGSVKKCLNDPPTGNRPPAPRSHNA